MKDLIVSSEIKQNLIIEFDKNSIENFIVSIEDSLKNLVVSEENMKDFSEKISKVNKVITNLKDYRKSTVDEATKPIKVFEDSFKDYEKRLEKVYRDIKNQIDEYTKMKTEENKKTLLKIRDTLCEENEILNIKELVVLPELKGELSNSKFTFIKAENLVKEAVNELLDRRKILESHIQEINKSSELSLKLENYERYLEDVNKAMLLVSQDRDRLLVEKERIRKEEELKVRKELEEKIRKEEELKIKKELEEKIAITKEKESEIENLENIKINKTIKLLIEISNSEIEKAKALKKFLVENEINYKKL